ncbi:hypothetical protein [Neobacillus massiliamazoniensis]|uniref:Putative lipoprotein n=1 Tax=Neobacillus massiliamazoniensis TaxID=1499688 RepID=A0A0U1NZY5_9BACI|nr:hypothetical protein [Neobacillus massiliamazoniensis]CRK83412.1 putative lipoprotein [Neobacillus massiliamazoniensis]
MKIKHLSVMLLTLALLAGCVNENKVAISPNEVNKISWGFIEKQTMEGVIVYSIKLINGSDSVIKQNNVFVSYPIITTTNVIKSNEYKVEVKGNKLDIQPGETITLKAFMPLEGMGDKSLLRIDDPRIQINGYLDKVDNNHKFSNGGYLYRE